MTRPNGRTLTLAGTATVFLALEIFVLWHQRNWRLEYFAAAALAQGAVYCLAVWAVFRRPGGSRTLGFVLVAAAVFRIGPLCLPPAWSTDVYRYVWDGRVQAAGFNPYCCIPNDPKLAPLRDAKIYPQINHVDSARTIYPPVAEMVFFGATRLAYSPYALKAVMTGFEALGIFVLIALLRWLGQPPQRIVLYAWHPLPVWEIAGSGHVDALMVAFVPLALLAALERRRALSGLALAAAVLTKFVPLVLVPALWRRSDWRMPAGFLGAAALGYLCYAGAGSKILGFLPGYLNEEHLTATKGSGFWLLDLLHRALGLDVPTAGYLAIGACALVLIGVGAVVRRDPDRPGLGSAVALAIAATVIMSPHYAWYFVWLLPVLTLRPWWPGLWLTVSAPVLYCTQPQGRIPLWEGGVIYGGFLLAAAGTCLARIVSTRGRARP